MTRVWAIAAIAGGAMLMTPAGVSAETLYPWCVQYAGGAEDIGATSCAFVSKAQCEQTAMGMGAMCMPNPAYPDTAPVRPAPKRHRDHR
jgi:hypothetical protein